MAAKIKIRWAGRNQQDRRGASSAALRGQQKAAFKFLFAPPMACKRGRLDAVFFNGNEHVRRGPPRAFLPKDAVRVKGGSISSSRCGGGPCRPPPPPPPIYVSISSLIPYIIPCFLLIHSNFPRVCPVVPAAHKSRIQLAICHLDLNFGPK